MFPIVWQKLERGTFRSARLGLKGDVGLGDRSNEQIARPWVSISSPLAHGLPITVFELFSWFHKRFSLHVGNGYDDDYRDSFVERQITEQAQATGNTMKGTE